MSNDRKGAPPKSGHEKRQEILGDEYLQPLLSGSSDFDQPYQDFVTDVLWGRAWNESSMDDCLKLRLNIAMFTVLGQSSDLVPYVRAALRRGISADEIREIITLAALYSGLPNGFRAIYAARDVIDEHQSDETSEQHSSAPTFQTFDRTAATFEVFRSAETGYQKICEWVGPENGGRYQAGIAELSHIRIAEYEFAFDDFLFVLEGSATLSDAERSETIGPGQAVFIPEGSIITIAVPDRLLWTYVAYTDALHWKDTPKQPGSIDYV